MRSQLLLTLALAGLLSACAPSKMSVTTPQVPVQTVTRLAIAPGSGVLGEAIAVELFNSGITVVDANEASTIVGRAGLREFELTSSEGYSALREAGIEAVLAAKSVDAADGTPESASVRITSTASGAVIAGITWQNGWGGRRGSIADRAMRKNLSEAAREIAAEIMKRIRPAR
jgi:hypothetical protein